MSYSAEDPRRTIASALAGAVWGHLIGDAVGVPYEFEPARRAEEVTFGATGTWSQPPGTWSDDGALMLALLDSLLDRGFDPEDQGRRALAWYRSERYTPDGDRRFDIGTTTAAAMRALEKGVQATAAGPADEHASGNGSLMRILPLALVDRASRDGELVERAHLASAVTHGHPRCQVACAVYSLVVRRLLPPETGSDSDGARWKSPEPWQPDREATLRDALTAVRRVYADGRDAARLAALDELEGWTERAGRGFVLDSFWSAWDAFSGATDYRDAIRRAVAYGRDTDTTAAIAGGLAGAYFGWERIPAEWLRGMRDRGQVTGFVDRLVATTGATTSTAKPLRVDFLPVADVPALAAGRLGITFLPGQKRFGWTGFRWRDLDLDLATLRTLGVDGLFLLNEDSELDRCLVSDIEARMAADGPDLIRFPVHDPNTPRGERLADFEVAIRELVRRIGGGETIAIACRGGLDRSGYAAGCVLVEAGLDAEEAIERVHRARRGSLTRSDGLALVRSWKHSEAVAG